MIITFIPEKHVEYFLKFGKMLQESYITKWIKNNLDL